MEDPQNPETQIKAHLIKGNNNKQTIQPLYTKLDISLQRIAIYKNWRGKYRNIQKCIETLPLIFCRPSQPDFIEEIEVYLHKIRN